MKPRFRIFSILFGCIALLFCSNGQAQESFTKRALIKDLDEYRDCIIKNAVDPFQKISKEEFIKEVENIKATADSKNTDELIIELMKLNAELLDEHSDFEGFEMTTILPFELYWFTEGIYITKTDYDNSKYLYSKLIAINHIPVDQVVRKIITILPDKNEGYIKEKAQKYLTQSRILHGLDIIDGVNSTSLTLVTVSGDTVTKPFHFERKKDIVFNKYNLGSIFLRFSHKGSYWYHYDTAGNYMYFNYSSCFPDEKYPFKDFVNDFFREVAVKNPGKIIIDLRENGGGVRATIKPFIAALSASKYNKPNTVFVLTGRKTFSAGMNNIFDLKSAIPITTIGESTGGSINHLGQPKKYTLSHTGLIIRCSSNHIVNNKDVFGPVIPDVIIPETLINYLKGIDAALNCAIAH